MFKSTLYVDGIQVPHAPGLQVLTWNVVVNEPIGNQMFLTLKTHPHTPYSVLVMFQCCHVFCNDWIESPFITVTTYISQLHTHSVRIIKSTHSFLITFFLYLCCGSPHKQSPYYYDSFFCFVDLAIDWLIIHLPTMNPSGSITYKARKEAFVSNLSGSSLTDINLVSLVSSVCIFQHTQHSLTLMLSLGLPLFSTFFYLCNQS